MATVPEAQAARLDRMVTQAEARYPVPSCFLCMHYKLLRSGNNWRTQCSQRTPVRKQLYDMTDEYWNVAENKACGCKHWDEVYD